MNIEAVTVSIGYGDFLAVTAAQNRHIFSRWLIVTSASDTETREVCRRFNLDCLVSEDHKRGGDFAKGRLIERGLQHLSENTWRLHLDADIVLPAATLNILEADHLHEDCIYGVDRVMVQNWKQWEIVRNSGYLQDQHDYHCRVRWPEGLQLGTRWASPQQGYVPIGFFQLWHGSADEWSGIRIKPYPQSHGNACRTDVQHALQWDRRKRILLPELIAVHLESEACPKGANWHGRKTKRFGSAPQPHKHGGYC